MLRGHQRRMNSVTVAKMGAPSGRRVVALTFLLLTFVVSVPAQEATGGPGTANGQASVEGVTATTLQFFHPKRLTFGRNGVPQRWINILGNVSDPTGITSLRYSLNGGLPVTLSIGPDTRRLGAAGDFNADIHLSALRPLPDSNVVYITAQNGVGVITYDSVIVRYLSGTVWPRVSTTAWASSSTLFDSAQVVDGLWNVVSGGLRIQQVGYDRLVGLGDTTWRDFEVTVPVTIHSQDPAGYGPISGSPAVGLFLGWSGHSDNPISGWQPKAGYKPFGCGGFYKFDNTQGDGHLSIWDKVDGSSGSIIPFNVPYYFKMRVESTGSGVRYSFKVWVVGGAEPPGNDLTWTGPLSDPQQGAIMVLAHWVDATFGPVVVKPITSDFIPPVLSAYGTILGRTSAEVQWQTDEMARGRIEYGLTTAYGSELANAELRVDHSFVLPGLAQNTTYHYRAIAFDESGNRAVSGDRVFTTTGAATLARDEFTIASLDSALWTVRNPIGDVSVTSTGGQLSLALPQNVAHTVTTGSNTMPQVLQPSADTDFEVEVKLNGSISQPVQGAGVHAVTDSLNLVRFEVYSDGSSTRAYAGVLVAGVPSQRSDVVLAPNGTVPVYMKVRRERNLWKQITSLDGVNWETSAQFNHTLVVQKVGLAARNQGAPPPAYTALFDYFRAALPSLPRLVLPANGTTNVNTSVNLVWSSSDGAQGYHLQVATNPQFTSGLVVNDSLLNDTSRNVTGLSAYTQYYWRVRSWNSEGKGPFSLSRWFSTYLPLPNQVALVAPVNYASVQPDSILCVWKANLQPGSKYWFELTDDSLFAYPDMDTSLVDTTKVLRGLELDKTYFWRVRAGNPTGWGPYSAMRRFRVSLTGVAEEGRVPSEVRLAQNYPNPFNPTTMIEYGVPSASHVRLEVYNTVGQRVALLVDGMKPPGYHREDFRPEGLASGIYFYRLSINNNERVLVKRMVFVR